VLAIQLGAADLARVRFQPTPGPLVDVAHAVYVLRSAGTATSMASPHPMAWPQDRRARTDPALLPALALVQPTGWSCGFFAPLAPDLPSGLDMVQAVPASRIRLEIDEMLGPAGRPSRWLRRLGDGDPEARHALRTALRRLHDLAVAGWEPWLRAEREADVARRLPLMGAGGAAAALNSLHPSVRLVGDVIEVDRPFDHVHRAGGDGVVLVPLPFLVNRVIVDFPASGPVVICYPTGASAAAAERGAGDPGGDPLARLLGGTRASVLREVRTGCGTLTLARRVGASPSTVSEHVAALRAAGLVSSRRVGRGVTHALTSLGGQLLIRTVLNQPTGSA